MQHLLGQDRADAPTLALAEALSDLERFFLKSTIPDRRRASQLASRTRYALDDWLQQSESADVARFSAQELRHIVSIKQTETETRWEALSQYYLAAIASRQSWNGESLPEVLVNAAQLKQSLVFDAGTISLAILDQTSGNANHSAEGLRSSLKVRDVPEGEAANGK